MKTSVIFLAFIFSGVLLFAQSPSDKLFQNMDGKEGVTILSFSKSMLDFVNMDFDDNEITGDLDKIKIMIYNASDVDHPMDLRKQASKYLSGRYKVVKPSDLDEDADDEADENVDIRVLRSGNRVKECHVIITDDDDIKDGGLIISFFGNFKIDDIKNLAGKAEKYN